MDCSCPGWEVPCEHHAAAFYLLAEAFDDDPFTILAWRGREREDLLANLHAGPSDGPPAADHAEQTGPPLADRFDSYFVIQAELPTTSPAVSSSTALLDQLPRVELTVRGQPSTELLRPAYIALGEEAASGPSDGPLGMQADR
jgi:uncharacterized Zn finger protein